LFLGSTQAATPAWLTGGNQVECGGIKNIPARVPGFTSMLIDVVQVVVPIILVIMGVIDLLKAVSGQKEDEIQKGRQVLFKRLIMGFLIFMITSMVKLIVNFAADTTALRDGIVECVDCFISGSCL
jgi:hypothetical protein